MNKKKKIFEGLLGFFILTASVIFLFHAFRGKKDHFEKRVQYCANFDEIQGVDLGTLVKIHGVDVGKVTRIRLDPKNYQVLVSFSVNQGIVLASNAKVSAMGESLLGKKILAIDPGDGSPVQPGHIFYDTYCSSHNLESLIEKFLFSRKESQK